MRNADTILDLPSPLVLGLALAQIACAAPASRGPEPPRAASSPSAASARSDAGSTIDPALQAVADQELDRTMATWQAAAGAVLVLDPGTGEILANAGRAGGARVDVATRRAFMTGSTFKAITTAAALDEGVISPADRFDCENGSFTYDGQTMRDPGAHGTLTVPEMLEVSTNIGFAKVFDRLGGARLGKWLRAFRFGVAPAIDGATSGEVPARIDDGSFDGAVVAIGESEWMLASPLQIAAAYAAFANGGAYVAPTLTRRASPPPRDQIMKPETARAVVAMLEGVVYGEHGTGKNARVAGVRVAGKTGTGEDNRRGGQDGVYASFVGIVPADHPRFVILVGVKGPRGDAGGGKVAAPVFASVAAAALRR